jgi:hypothetical protein
VAPWLLAAVMTWSGSAKLREPDATALALLDFKLTGRLRPGLGRALGATELALAGLLVISHVTEMLVLPVMAITAALLWAFSALIARALLTGERFACFCFGNRDAQISRVAVLRAGALAALATVVATAGPAAPSSVRLGGLEVVAALGLLGTTALVATLRNLVRWNDDPFMLSLDRVTRRAP